MASTRSRSSSSTRKTSRASSSSSTSRRSSSSSGGGGVSGAAKATTNHEKIRKWVEARGGHPACVRGTGRRKGDTGMLRIDYPGFSGQQKLQEISWDEFFEAFDQNNLAFLYQDKTKGGKQSRFSKLVDRGQARSDHGRSAGGVSSRSKSRSSSSSGSRRAGSASTRGRSAR